MFSYQLRIEIKEDKIDEFIEFLSSFRERLREEEGCLSLNLYRDIEDANNYGVISEWKTKEDMEKHFKRKQFSLLVGAAKVLGEHYELKIGETIETGTSELAQKKIALHLVKGNAAVEILKPF